MSDHCGECGHALSRHSSNGCTGADGMGCECPGWARSQPDARTDLATMRAALDAIHRLVGESPDSDDASLPEVVARHLRERDERIAEYAATILEDRLRAFAADRHRVNVCVTLTPGLVDPWILSWWRTYRNGDNDGGVGEYRVRSGATLADAIAAAEDLEAENDLRKPQYADKESTR